MTVKIERFEIKTGKDSHVTGRGGLEVGIYDYLLQKYLMSFFTEDFDLNMKLANLCLDKLNEGGNDE